MDGVLQKLWKTAAVVGGVAGIGAALFYSLYSQWLTLPIFERLTGDQTFAVMLVFLALVFLVAIAMLVAWLVDQNRTPSNTRTLSITFEIPHNCNFEQAVRALAKEAEAGVQFIGFSPESLRTELANQTITASDTSRAIELLKTLGKRSIPRYIVQKKDGLYVLAIV